LFFLNRILGLPFKGGRLWRPRFLINPDRRSTLLTVVK
jgi:hypothetical protein